MQIRKNRSLTLTGIILLFFSNLELTAQPTYYTPYLQIESNHYSPAIPIQQLRNELKGPAIKSGEYAFSNNYAQLGVKIKNASLSAFNRLDFYTTFTNDTLKVLHADKNKLPQTQNQSFNIDLYGFHLKASGVKAAYRFEISEKFYFDVALSYLHASAMYEGVLQGLLRTGDDDIQGRLSLDYSYNKDIFFSREPSSIHGYGYSTDLNTHWQVAPKTKVTLIIKDLYSHINWNQQHHTIGTATTNTVLYNNEGLIDARPAIEWLEDEKSLTQELPRQIKLKINHNLHNDWQLEGQIYRYDDLSFYSFGAHYRIRPDQKVAGFINFEMHSISFSYQSKYAAIMFTSDNLDWNQAHNLGLNVSIQWPLKPK